jgi:hypothetical protein
MQFENPSREYLPLAQEKHEVELYKLKKKQQDKARITIVIRN